MRERYEAAIHAVESSDDPAAALPVLQELQLAVAQQALFSSSSSERLEDLPTSSLPFLTLEHTLALAYTKLPMTRQQ